MLCVQCKDDSSLWKRESEELNPPYKTSQISKKSSQSFARLWKLVLSYCTKSYNYHLLPSLIMTPGSATSTAARCVNGMIWTHNCVVATLWQTGYRSLARQRIDRCGLRCQSWHGAASSKDKGEETLNLVKVIFRRHRRMNLFFYFFQWCFSPRKESFPPRVRLVPGSSATEPNLYILKVAMH